VKRLSIIILLLASVLTIGADAQFKRRCEPKTPCAATLEDCGREGCSDDNHHDPDLNKLKNLKSSTKPITDKSLNEMIALEQAVRTSGYNRGDPRNVLRDLGEGDQIRVVGYLLAVKQECGESCNCGLHDVDVTTDNHLVLVTPNRIRGQFALKPHATKKQITAMFHQREPGSVTAEFTPRVRADGHPNFTSDVQDMINQTAQGALWVRITGQLMFDSEHFRHNPLTRRTNWEVHPILKFEYCPKGKTCTQDSDANWVDIDQ
jgi:hypothetical protein